MVERRLRKVAEQLSALREELRVLDEQLVHFDDAADDARLRSLVSETPAAEHDHREAQRHADAMKRRRADVATEIERLEIAQDQLLDRLTEERR